MGTGDIPPGSRLIGPSVQLVMRVHQPRACPSMSPKTTRLRPREERMTPPISSLRWSSPRDSVMTRQTRMRLMRPSGTLMKNAQRQEATSASHPPSSGPKAAMPPKTAPHSPKAAARMGPRKFTLMIAIEVGSIIAPPTASPARARISMSPSWARPATTLKMMKMTVPIMNRRLRPMRSASTPKVISRAAKTSE